MAYPPTSHLISSHLITYLGPARTVTVSVPIHIPSRSSTPGGLPAQSPPGVLIKHKAHITIQYAYQGHKPIIHHSTSISPFHIIHAIQYTLPQLVHSTSLGYHSVSFPFINITQTYPIHLMETIQNVAQNTSNQLTVRVGQSTDSIPSRLYIRRKSTEFQDLIS